ncbi:MULTISPECIES: phage major capsid protein [Enterococcus]|uniref:phage major capsid protein n=1 Tax=Enterococcus TaxID=1350 RepID=UPI000B6435D9|nr:phage major capsid protein [Enterococcus sp. 4E1_DIV0656]OTO09112.1 HK97 family phage major capsid protein [Enterococcus sp. 4E1_DIV0656]
MKTTTFTTEQTEKIAQYSGSFTSNSVLNISEAKQSVKVMEALTSQDASILMPKVIQQVVTEAAEAEYLASLFFKKIKISEGRSMEFIHFGAIRASEVAEGQEYPEQTLNLTKNGTGTVDVRVKKYGLKISITDEMISDSSWDVIGLHLQAAGRALARLKEENMFRHFSSHGHVVFDGKLFAAGEDGYPTGRGFDGNYNGTLAAEDIIDMAVSIMAAGFNPTDIIMHPLCWSLFAKNAALEGASVAAFGQGVAGTDPRNFNTSNALGINVMFSPYVVFDQGEMTFDFYLVDRNNVGVLLVKDEISTEQFDDPTRDIQALKLKERYGIGVLNGGLGIAVAKNIRFAKTYPAPERRFAEMALPTDYVGEEAKQHDKI